MLENAQLEVVARLPELGFDVRAPQHGIRLHGARPRVFLDRRAAAASAWCLVEEETLPAPEGGGCRVSLRGRVTWALTLRLTLELTPGASGIVIGSALENTGREPLTASCLEPFGIDRPSGGIELPGERGALRFFRMGYQSWSPSAHLPLRGVDRRPRLPLARHVHFGPFTPRPRRGLHVSDFVTSLRASGHAGLTLGFLSHERLLSWVSLSHRYAVATGLRAQLALETIPLAPGELREGEVLWLGIDAPGEDGLARWAELAGERQQARVQRPSGSGWCSWYEFYTGVTAEDIQRSTRLLASRAPWLDTVQIDDGYAPALGDWLEPSAGFPEGLAPLAREIRGVGFRAGVWLAPFLVSRSSKIARREPGWLLRDRRGRPRWAAFGPAWKGRIGYALDPTHPEVLAWLQELSETMRGLGFEYQKLDFLYAGALRGRRHAERIPSAAAYRQGIAALRRGAGAQSHLLGCGAPLGPSIGLFESMRVGPDVAPRWRSPLSDALLGVPAAPAARNALRSVVARAALHGRLWQNDPDCVLLRDRDTHLDTAEARSLASAAALSGGPAVLSDAPEKLSPERWRWLMRMHPGMGHRPETLPLRGQTPEGLRAVLPDGSLWLLYLNLESRAYRPRCELSELGLRGPVHVFDIWRECDLGLHESTVPLGRLKPGECHLLRLTPAGTGPRVIGSTLHLSGGGAELLQLGDPCRELHLHLPGDREGRLLIASGDGPPVWVPVRFRDELRIDLSAGLAALVEREGMPDALEG